MVHKLLALRGVLVSLNVLSCQALVLQRITNQGGDYLLGLKVNLFTRLAEAECHTAALPASQAHKRWVYASDSVPVRYPVWT